MKAIDTLMNEHRFIVRVLDALDIFNERVSARATEETGDYAKFAEFFGQFADRCHHGKEEDILFEEMASHGFSKDAGPLSVMYVEHTIGRERVSIMRSTGEAGKLTDEQRAQVTAAASEYSTLLRQHIRKEDNVLYPMAEQNLPEQVMEEIHERFEEFERTVMGPGIHESFHRLGDDLTKKYSA